MNTSGFKEAAIKTEKGVIRDCSKSFGIHHRYIIGLIVAMGRPNLLKNTHMKEWQYASFP